MHKNSRSSSFGGFLLVLGLAALSPLKAGTYTNDFNKFDPANPVGATVNGNANDTTVYDDSSGGVDNTGVLKLTLNIGSQQSSFIINDLDNGKAIGGFTAKFKMRIGGGSSRPADGVSFSFARATDGVLPSGTVGEEGTGTGLVIEFDTWDNGNEAPALDVKLDGTEIARTKMDGQIDGNSGPDWRNAPVFKDPAGKPFSLETGDKFEDVVIDFRDSLLNVAYKGVVIYTNLLVPVAPYAGQFVIGARTGGANDNQWIDNLGITTFPPSTIPVISGVSSGPDGVTITLTDGATALDSKSVKLTFDNATVTPTITKSGNVTTIKFTTATLLAAGSTHTAALTYSDNGTPVTTKTVSLPFTVPNFVSVPAANLVTGVDKTKPGFRLRPYGTEADNPNSLAWTEDQLAGLHGPNTANLTGAVNGFFTVTDVINFDIGSGAGNFQDSNGHPDSPFPGFPGTQSRDGGTGNASEEVLTFLDFPAAGVYTMGVNSDDGFRVSTAANPLDKATTVLGQFDAGRGSADTIFTFFIPQAGTYPFRLIWENGGGGANLEWFTVVGGTKILINDKKTDGHINAFAVGPAGPAFAKSISPAPNAVDVSLSANPTLVLTDADTQVDPASVKAQLDGAAVPATATKSGSDTTAVVKPAAPFATSSKHTVNVTFSDKSSPPVSRTVTWSFTTGILGLPGTLFIEAEDFNFSHGQTIQDKPIGMTGSYPGGDFQDKGNGLGGSLGDGSDLGIDYFEVDSADNSNGQGNDYRPNTGVEAGKKNEAGESNRGDFDVQVNHIVGWNDAGDWYNYTRKFPDQAKFYNIFGRLASGGQAIRARLDEVTSAATTTNQTLVKLGEFKPGRATAGWDSFESFPLLDDSGNPVSWKASGTHTLRVTTLPGNVDYDYLVFVPAAVQATPPTVTLSVGTSTQFAVGAPITLTATATTTDGTITKVEFFAGTNKVGEATSSPFTATVNNLATGRFALTAKATASTGLTATSSAVNIIVGTPPDQVLMVVGTASVPNLNAADAGVRDRLVQFGFEVIAVNAPTSKTSDADGKVLVITSSTVNSGDVTTRFRDVTIPVLNWEQALQDDYLMTLDQGGVTRGTTTGQRDINIVKADHPMAAGFPVGKLTVADSDVELSWGVPATSATIIATITDDATHACIYGFEKGAVLIDGTTKAPARRVHFLNTDNTYASLNDNGKKLFDAALGWALNRTLTIKPTGSQLSIAKSGNNVTISWTGTGTLQKADKVTGPWTDVSGASPQTVPIAGQARFFRVKQ